MSNNKMLIDAAHPEETRVVVLRNGRVEEFDYESAARKLLRGNIYLAKVTRVEPSLQAAFVDYGGNRHGFLAFNEIHPDYYQIPIADRELLKQEEAAAAAEAEAAAEARAERRARQQEERRARARNTSKAKALAKAAPSTEVSGEIPVTNGSAAAEAAAAAVKRAISVSAKADDIASEEADPATDHETPADNIIADTPRQIGLVEDTGLVEDPALIENGAIVEEWEQKQTDQDEDATDRLSVSASDKSEDANIDHSDDLSDADIDHDDEAATTDDDGADPDASVEEVGSEDAMEEVAERPRRRARQYKIQEVIKRRQVLLVQVVKEERGNKGAALTTYLSLAGRYTVLMPNTGRGGGISRKINNAQDRKRLKAIANELDVPEGMGLIIRTAGATRTKNEIQRDFDYLLRLWESVRELTLESSAPNLVYEEGNLIKRSIRDLYTKEIDEVHVAGETAYEEAKEFMGMLMPSHAKNVIHYQEPQPLFAKHQIERQLNAMFSPYVTLKSGGYIVINQTEALVSVDVNSGKSTREFSIEQTALNTNLEAAEELGRQLKLRDLAGLIVIDFIDMEERRNNRAVERKIKECLKNDRARIQVSRISHFGLLEMSRQRMRTGVLEGSTTQCPHCTGTGTIRSTESVALAVLRGLEDALLGSSRHSLTAITTATVGLYILNNKRSFINEMEERYGISITIEASDQMQGANFTIEKSVSADGPQQRRRQSTAVNMETGFAAQTSKNSGPDRGSDTDGEQKKPRRRRRRRGGRSNRDNAETRTAENSATAPQQTDWQDEDRVAPAAGASSTEPTKGATPDSALDAQNDGEQKPRRSRHRGRRGGRRNRDRENGRNATADQQSAQSHADSVNGAAAAADFNQIPGSGEQPDLGDVPALHGAAPQVIPSDADTAAMGNRGGRSRTRGRARGRGRSSRNSDKASPTGASDTMASAKADKVDQKPGAQGANAKADRTAADTPPAAKTDTQPTSPSNSEPAAANNPSQRKGWWQRAFSSD